MAEFEKMIGDAAERAIAGRMRVERSELVGKVLEELVLGIVAQDERFYSTASGGFWGLTARRDGDELARLRRQEEVAAADSAGEWLEPSRVLEPYGVPFGDAA
jgi:hypothetical protein